MTNSIFKILGHQMVLALLIEFDTWIRTCDFELIQNSSILISVIRNLAVKNPHFFKKKRAHKKRTLSQYHFFKNQIDLILWSFIIDKMGVLKSILKKRLFGRPDESLWRHHRKNRRIWWWPTELKFFLVLHFQMMKYFMVFERLVDHQIDCSGI